MSLNQPLQLSSALVHQVLLSPTTYPYKQVIYDLSTSHLLEAILGEHSPVVRRGWTIEA